MNIDYLIVGQGLAGSVLSRELIGRGARVLVVDRDEETTSSKVAAGLVNPAPGPRFTIDSAKIDRLNAARRFYWDFEEETEGRFFHHVRFARLFRDEEEKAAWRRAMDRDGSRLPEVCEPLEIDEDRWNAPLGGVEIRDGGWLDAPAFLEAIRQWLLERAAYAIGTVKHEEVEIESDGRARWKNVTAGKIVFAEGWKANRNPWFDRIPMDPVAGDILSVQIPDLASQRHILQRGQWLIPIGRGRFRTGSNYRRDFSENPLSESGRRELEKGLSSLTPLPADTLEHRAAIRPVMRRGQVCMGIHPDEESIALFNGLGSKGALEAPWHATRLADHFLENRPLPPDTDLRDLLD